MREYSQKLSMSLSEGYMFDPCPELSSKHFSKDLSLTIIKASTFTGSVNIYVQHIEGKYCPARGPAACSPVLI